MTTNPQYLAQLTERVERLLTSYMDLKQRIAIVESELKIVKQERDVAYSKMQLAASQIDALMDSIVKHKIKP
jgi:phage shock protein A